MSQAAPDRDASWRHASGEGSGFSPFILFRRGTVPADALGSLVARGTWELLEQAEKVRVQRERLRDDLVDALHDLVPRLPTPQRRQVLQIKRAVHADRLPAATVDDGLWGVLPGETAAVLRQWLGLAEQGRRLVDAAEDTLTTELDAGRRALARMARNVDFLLGVQLSGEDVYREVRDYAERVEAGANVPGKPSQHRKIENTILSFACRSALKPSPFGSFTELGVQPWRPAEASQPGDHRRIRLTRASRGLLTWMGHQLRHIDGSDDLLQVHLNNTAEQTEGRVSFFVRGLDGDSDRFGEERFVSLPATDAVLAVMDMVGNGVVTMRQLVDRLASRGVGRAAARRFVDALADAGLCHAGLGLPDQTPDYAAAVAKGLGAVPTAQAAACAGIFNGIHVVEKEFAIPDPDRRQRLLSDVRAYVSQFSDLCGIDAPPGDISRSLVFEDVGTVGGADSWAPEVVERNAENMTLFQRMLPVLDHTTVERLGLYTFFASRYGEHVRGVGLLDFYREFARLPPRALTDVMLGTGDPYADAVRSIRADIGASLRGMLGQIGDGESLELAPEWLAACVADLPPYVVPWRSAAYRIQFSRQDRVLAVLNGVTTGHGVFFSRYCDLFAGATNGWSLDDALRSHINRTSPRQADLTAVMGMNFNLHPRLSPLEVVYPGSLSNPSSPPALSLRELVVRCDEHRRRLVLASRRDDEPVDLVPLNFLYPAAGPRLYRFLCAFAPTRTYRGGLWDQFPAALGADRTALPRVTLGDLVLDRRTWRMPASNVPASGGPSAIHLDGMLRLDRWRKANALPRQCFFRVSRPLDAAVGADWVEETRRWALEARSARLHKPHFLDFDSPLLVRVFANRVADAADDQLTMQECLPGTSEYRPPGPGSAEEIFVEHSLEQDGWVATR